MKRRKDGRFQLSVTLTNPLTGTKKRVYVYGYTEAEVQTEKRNLLRKMEELVTSLDTTTFKHWYIECLKDKLEEKLINEVTFNSYMKTIHRHVLPNLPANVKLTDIKPYHIRNILKLLPKNRTQEYVYTILHSLFKEALYEGLMNINPCEAVRKPRHKAEPADVMSPDVYKKIMSAVESTQLYYVFFLSFETGCRRGELCGLRWADFDEGNKTLSIRQSIKQLNGKGIFIGTPKSSYSIRTLPVSDNTVSRLKEWQKILRRRLYDKGLPWDINDYIFRSESDLSKPMPPDYITRSMGRLKHRLDLPSRICVHSFRHTHATLMAQTDLNPKKIQVRMGHASASFTMERYIHSDGMQDGVIDALAETDKLYNL